MMKATALLPQIVAFEILIKARAVQFFSALGGFEGTSGHVEKIDYRDDQIQFRMRENTRHDCPDRTTICIFADTLDLDAEEWNQFICKTYLETEEKETMKKELLLERQRQARDK
jgi:hypothetical protein